MFARRERGEQIMYKNILILMSLLYTTSVQSIALADYTVTAVQPYVPNNYQNYSYPSYGQNIYQDNVQYSNPYQAQCQSNYQYPNGYTNYGYMPSYTNPLPYSILNSAFPYSGTNGVKQQIIRNIGRNIIYSMMR